MEFSDIAIPIMQATVSVLALYFALLHLEIHLVTIVETTSNSDHVDERYRVVTSKNRPNPSHVYAEFVDERVDVDNSGGGQGATTSSAGLEDDAVSTLSEHIELSESRAPRDGEDSEEVSEEVSYVLRILHRLTFAPLPDPSRLSLRYTDWGRKIDWGRWHASRVLRPVA
ncbi:hypothetical protein EDB85DRAFT_1434873 [Lactarius pseudohatsudake]|nr:hypothetical protein EDB85DRAFT_1434873 [Lactarius pseudohatsudake]